MQIREFLFVAFALAGCSGGDIVPAVLPPVTERVSPLDRGQSFRPDLSYSVDVLLQSLEARRPDTIAFSDMDVCDAAQLVVGSQLGVPVTCSGAAQLSFVSYSRDPSEVLALFTLGVASLGGEVLRSKNGINVKAGSGTVSVFEGGDKNFATGPNDQVNEVGFSVVSAQDDFYSLARNAILSGGARQVRYFVSNSTLSDLQDLISILGVTVDVRPYGKGFYLFGEPRDISMVVNTAFLGGDFTTSIEHSGFTELEIEQLAKVYPSIAVAPDQSAGIVRISGEPDTVQRFLRDIRSNNVKQRNVHLQVTFLTASNSAIQSQIANAGVDFSDGTFSANIGGVGSDFFVVLDDLVSKTTETQSFKTDMIVKSGKTATYKSGKKVPVATSIDEFGRRSFEYQDTGLLFTALPTFNKQGVLSLAFTVSVSSSSAASSADENPTIAESSMLSTLDVTDGDVIVVGGLDTLTNSKTASKRLKLFPSSGNNDASTNSIFVIRIVKTY